MALDIKIELYELCASIAISPHNPQLLSRCPEYELRDRVFRHGQQRSTYDPAVETEFGHVRRQARAWVLGGRLK